MTYHANPREQRPTDRPVFMMVLARLLKENPPVGHNILRLHACLSHVRYGSRTSFDTLPVLLHLHRQLEKIMGDPN